MTGYVVTDAWEKIGKPVYLVHRHDTKATAWHRRWKLIASFDDQPTAVAVAIDLNKHIQ